MAKFLNRVLKPHLVTLATELGVEIDPLWTRQQIIQGIQEMEGFSSEAVEDTLEAIKEEERLALAREKEERALARENEKRARDLENEKRARDLEREKMALEIEREKLALDRERERLDREDRMKELQMAHEIEKLKLSQDSTLRTSTPQPNETARKKCPDLKRLMPDFAVGKDDISLYLSMFERQCKVMGVEEELWASQLLAILPIDISQIILRDAESELPTYAKARALLLERFKLTAEAFRQKFTRHAKRPEVRWADFAYEMQNYLDGWLEGLKIKTFEELKDLMLTDAIKRKVGTDFRQHAMDKWADIVSPWVLVQDLDKFELAQTNFRKPENQRKEFRKEKRPPFETETNKVSNNTRNEPVKFNEAKRDSVQVNNKPGAPADRKKKSTGCFVCGSNLHYKINCPFKNKPEGTSTELSNFVRTDAEIQREFEPYISKARVGGRKLNFFVIAELV